MARILHISDLHLQTRDRAETAADQLLTDLQHEVGITTLDAIIVSGDHTERATSSEYEAAAGFVRRLSTIMKVDRRCVLIVPGNHDVDWSIAKKSYSICRASEVPASTVSRYQNPANRDYVEVVTDPELYQRRFRKFSVYYSNITGRTYARAYKNQFDVITSADNSVVLVGFNSAWNLDHHYPDRSSIAASALNDALSVVRDRICKLGIAPLILACWHHPIRGEAALKDIAFLQRLAVEDVVVVLHGHVHKAEAEQFNYEWTQRGRRIVILGAGTLDSVDVCRGYPWQYNIIITENRRLEIRSRAKSERDGAWHADARFLGSHKKPPADILRLNFTKSVAYSGVKLEPSDGLPRRQEPLQTVSELKAYLRKLQYSALGYRLAVEALIFDPNGKLLVQERGAQCRDEVGKLECLGGQVFGEDLIKCTIARVRELIGEDIQIQVDELLDVQPARFVEAHGPEDWIVVAYLCRLVGGVPRPVNPAKTASVRWVDLAELHAIPDEKLSRSTSRQRDVYRVKYRMNPYFSRVGGIA